MREMLIIMILLAVAIWIVRDDYKGWDKEIEEKWKEIEERVD